MKNNIHTRLSAGITALALTCTLGLSGCSSANNRFTITPGNDGSFVVNRDTWIDNNGLNNIYVIEVKNNISNQNELYIARKIKVDYLNESTKQDFLSYTNILNNLEIYNDKSEETKHNLEILEETPLFDYLLAYDLVKSRYYYDDMLTIYNKIKVEYELKKDKAMAKKLIIENNKL